jgi:hypothetical protein
LKKAFETKYKSNWHCIVGKSVVAGNNLFAGRNFGAHVTHETGRYIYFHIGQKGFLIWSTPT